MMTIHNKVEKLRSILQSKPSVAIAYSGGVDSTFLIKVAYDILQDKAVAVTARLATFPPREFKAAHDYARVAGIRQIVVDLDDLSIKGFAANPANRCYLCKREIFNQIIAAAHRHKIESVADGSNADDLGDYRPGRQALLELGVASPLQAAGMTKDDIRTLSKDMNLPTWDKPAFACLASRIPYGEPITEEKLAMVDAAEQYLMDKGFRQVRVRHHGDIARIEITPQERAWFLDRTLMNDIDAKLREIGFIYVTLDLQGYRTGSMNESLNTNLHNKNGGKQDE